MNSGNPLCTNPLCFRAVCNGDCHNPRACSDCSATLTAEEDAEERSALRPQCFACIEKAWAATEMKIRARHCIAPPPPDTIPAPPMWAEAANDSDLESALGASLAVTEAAIEGDVPPYEAFRALRKASGRRVCR